MDSIGAAILRQCSYDLKLRVMGQEEECHHWVCSKGGRSLNFLTPHPVRLQMICSTSALLPQYVEILKSDSGLTPQISKFYSKVYAYCLTVFA